MKVKIGVDIGNAVRHVGDVAEMDGAHRFFMHDDLLCLMLQVVPRKSRNGQQRFRRIRRRLPFFQGFRRRHDAGNVVFRQRRLIGRQLFRQLGVVPFR